MILPRKLLLVLSLVMLGNLYGHSFGKTAHLKEYVKPGQDVTAVLQGLIDKYQVVIIDEGEWLLSGEIRLRSNVTIRGVGCDKSKLKRKEFSPLKKGKMFYTEKANTDSYQKENESDGFSISRVRYENIHFENLTIDFNRSPETFSDQNFLQNLYGIALIRTSKASIRNCKFIDAMTEKHHNGAPAVVVYQSENIKVQNNYSNPLTLIQVIFSERVTVSGNHCQQSIGTAIEFISGRKHKCMNNQVDKVWWKVSCIGINSTDCVVRGNIVKATDGNISSLTLGHEPILFRADNTIAENNVLHSTGIRSIIIQNGCGIKLRKNVCTCIIYKGASEMTSGCVVASGRTEGIYDIKILNNDLTAIGDGNQGCITYRGTGKLYIEGNTITATRAVNIMNPDRCDVKIKRNTVNYSIH